jgi:hypothetical protein
MVMDERLSALLFALGTGLLAHPSLAEPFATRNQSPLVVPFGLPAALPARLPPDGPGRLSLVSDWGNMVAIEGPEDNLVIDAETVELRLGYERSIGRRFAVRVSLPWRSISGGSLDGLAESWHDLLGLPDGKRGSLPRDRIQIRYAADGDVLLDIDRASSGVGDITLAGGYQVYDSGQTAIATWLGIKLPSGDAERLTGSGATDVALSITGQSALSTRWQVFGQLDAVHLGRGDLLPALQEEFAWSALAGVAWNAWRGIDLIAQVHSNSAVFGADATGLSGSATVLTFGGRYRTQRGWVFDVGFSEDLDVGASPDFVIHLGVALTL